MRLVACASFDSNVLLDGAKCVTSMSELYKLIADPESTELVIRKDFATKYFTPMGLVEFITNAQKLNTRLSVESETIQMSSFLGQVKKLASIKDTAEFIYALEKSPQEIFGIIEGLCRSYVSAYSETLEANNKVSTQHLQIANLQRQLEEKDKVYQDLIQRNHETEERLHILLSRINYQYGHNINMETILNADGNRYDKVLYIKEITRVHYVDTFIYYLQEIMRTLYGVPCRLCVMEPFYTYDRDTLYPRLKPSWDMTAEDVYSSDIFMAGYQPTLVEDILKNSSNVRYLIILDRLGDFDIHVTGDNVENLWTVSDLNDMGNISYLDRIISYSVDTLNIPHIQGFEAKTNAEKMSLYSSIPSMQAVINLLEQK